MRYSSAALFAALLACGSMSPAFACRSGNYAKIDDPNDERFVKAGPNQYNVKRNADSNEGMILVFRQPSHDLGFCVDLSVLESSDLQNTATGVMFWSTTSDPGNVYFLYIRNDQYRIVHYLFNKQYELVPWTTNASIKKGLGQKNEVDLWFTPKRVDIQINGARVTDIIARPSADAQNYGVAFQTPKTGGGLFQVGFPPIVK